MNRNSAESNLKTSVLEKNLCVIVPTYNNGGTVCDIIRRVSNYTSNIIVVNDGSTDDTRKLLKGLSTPFHLVDYDKNCGKGGALVAGFKAAHSLGYKYAITIDSDGQHFPEDIPVLIEAARRNPNSIIVGSRNLEGKIISRGSVFANRFSNFWFAVQTGTYLPDTQTGFRLYPIERMNFLSLVTARYESELELMVFASWNGVKLVSVPINVYYPPMEERVSHFRPGYDFARISLLNTFLCLGAVLYGYPRKLFMFLRSILYSLFSLVVFVFGAFLLSTFALVYLKLLPANEKKRLNFHHILCAIARWVARSIPGTTLSVNNQGGEKFERPAVIISNHQSHLDLMYAMMLTPKMVILTKEWVWNNPFYGAIVRLAEFYPVTEGYEKTLEYVAQLAERGYSVLVYPEGSRSKDCSIQRFHRGAFYIAEKLNLDVLPIIEYGPGKVLPKTGLRLLPGKVHVDIKPRIAPNDISMGEGFRERTKRFETYYKKEYNELLDRINFG